ncbi:hypothetical protein VTN00DRAFT_7258 [Thermoascus crustaceus]|uniref:uncharacterized protein n=1 Tax=Thermoascus crustaceus TaxID=5088 RepID=UPI003744AAA1
MTGCEEGSDHAGNAGYNANIDGDQEETLRGIGDWILESTQYHTADHPQEIPFSIGDDGNGGRDDNGGDERHLLS